MYLSIVIPVYNESKSIKQLYEEIIKVMGILSKPYEIIFVDDGSLDGSFGVLESFSADAKGAGVQLKCLQFRKNFGKSAALTAGFKEAKGDLVITMDGDLQDNPKEIPRFLDEINKGYDLVSGWKANRKDPLSKVIPSKLFNFTTFLLSGVKLHDFNCGFKCYRKEAIKELSIYGELYRYIPVLLAWRGFKIGEIEVEHRRRKFGKSKFGASRFLKGFFDFLTIMFLTKYARRPLHFFGVTGIVLFLTGASACFYLSLLWFTGQRPIGNRPLLLFGVLFILSGFQFIFIGLIGELFINHYSSKEEAYSLKKVI